ncbi:unnamed protein product [Lupinus luteus]|uniref:Uncharacterized protein n=1 Tax=Lupinus luteus TaxID=3873 RepID=A0AAV1Y407_LUPLU
MLSSSILINNSFTRVIPDSIGNLIILQPGLSRNNLTSDHASSEIIFLTSLTKCRKPKSVASSYNPLNGTLQIIEKLISIQDTIMS